MMLIMATEYQHQKRPRSPEEAPRRNERKCFLGEEYSKDIAGFREFSDGCGISQELEDAPRTSRAAMSTALSILFHSCDKITCLKLP